MFFDFVLLSGYLEADERRLRRMLRLLFISLNTPHVMHLSFSAEFSSAKFFSSRLSPESRHLVTTRKLANSLQKTELPTLRGTGFESE